MSGYLSDLSSDQQRILNEFIPEIIKLENEILWKNNPPTSIPPPPSASSDAEESLISGSTVSTKYDALRFLRARKFDLKESLSMYSKHLEWRVKNKIADIDAHHGDRTLEPKQFALVNKLIPHTAHGFDKGGRPVIYEKLGKVDVVALMGLVNGENYLAAHIYKMQKMVNVTRMAEKNRRLKNNKGTEIKENKKDDSNKNSTGSDHLTSHQFEDPSGHIETFNLVLDLKGCKLDTRKTTGYLNICAENDANHYPERLNKLIVINVPYTFHLLWKLAQGLIDEKTKKKIIVVYGSPLKALSELIDTKYIPAEYGGECQCQNGVGMIAGEGSDDSKVSADSYNGIDKSDSTIGWSKGCIPEFDLNRLQLSELTGNGAGGAGGEDETKEITVNAGKNIEEKLEIQKGQLVLWFFRTVADDIHCTVRLIPKGGDEKNASLLFEQRTQTAQGQYQCEQSGTVIIKFDNHFSYFKSKKLKYAFASISLESTDLVNNENASNASNSSSDASTGEGKGKHEI